MTVPLPRRFKRAAGVAPGRRNHRSWMSLLLGFALFAGAFWIGLWLAFPVAWLRQVIARELGPYHIELAIETLTVSPTFVVHGRQAVMRFQDPRVPALVVDRFELRPLWGSLLQGDPGMLLKASLLQGDVEATLLRSGRLQAQAGHLVLDLPLQEGLATFRGILDKGELHRSAAGKAPVESSLSLLLTDCSLSSPLLAATASRPLALGKVTLAATGRGQAFTIARLEASDGDLLGSGNGTVIVGARPADSRLSLNLQLRPTARLLPELAMGLDMLAKRGADGNYPIKIGGTLAQPRIAATGAVAPANAGEE